MIRAADLVEVKDLDEDLQLREDFAAGAKLRRPFGRIFGNGTAIEDKTEARGTMLLPLSGV